MPTLSCAVSRLPIREGDAVVVVILGRDPFTPDEAGHPSVTCGWWHPCTTPLRGTLTSDWQFVCDDAHRAYVDAWLCDRHGRAATVASIVQNGSEGGGLVRPAIVRRDVWASLLLCPVPPLEENGNPSDGEATAEALDLAVVSYENPVEHRFARPFLAPEGCESMRDRYLKRRAITEGPLVILPGELRAVLELLAVGFALHAARLPWAPSHMVSPRRVRACNALTTLHQRWAAIGEYMDAEALALAGTNASNEPPLQPDEQHLLDAFLRGDTAP